MVRNSYYLIAFIAALTTLAVLAHSQPLPVPTGTIEPQAINSQHENAAVPICYIQLQNGQLRDLRRLCGKTASPLPARNTQNTIQRPNLQTSPDSEDDDVAPTATPTPRRTPSQTTPSQTTPQSTPTKPSPQPTNSPTLDTLGTPDRSTSAPSPASPATNPSSTPRPLAIPAGDSQ